MSEEHRLEAVMLAEARADVAMADHKASMVLAALGIGFGALAGGLLARDWEPSHFSAIGEILWWLGAVAALFAVAFAAAAVWPRFEDKDVGEGVYYWGHVATFAMLREFVENLDTLPPSRTDRTLHQLWHVSRIVCFKYRLVRRAIGSSFLAVLLFLLASLIGG